MDSVAIVVGTFGGQEWVDLANQRALPSAEAQAPVQGASVQVIHCHAETLAQARNRGAQQTTAEWLIFLDASDELASGYVEAILAGSADLRGPAVAYFCEEGDCTGAAIPFPADGVPRLIPPKDLRRGNYLVIGTALRRSMFEEIGGFREWPAWEDWDLFVRCWLRGATVEQIPQAIYRAWVTPNGRNNLDPTEAQRLIQRMRRDHRREAGMLGVGRLQGVK